MAEQLKGLSSFVWGGLPMKGLAENAVTYDLGELGDTLSALDTVVHLKRNPNAVVTGVTFNIVKGTEGLNELLALILTKVPYPLTMNDTGIKFKGFMPSSGASLFGIGDSTGSSDVEAYNVTFKGNLQILSLE